MKAYVTTIGEVTTELCVWSLERNGFEVVLIDGKDTLASKLKRIYETASLGFVRVDADIIVNQSMTPKMLETLIQPEIWWWQFQCFDWFQQALGFGGVQFIRQDALPTLRKRVGEFMEAERPETQLSRVPEFYHPRRFDSSLRVVGLNNYKNDVNRVKATKDRRQQKGYDWELVEKLEQL